MATVSQRISPMLWFDDQAEEAAEFYTAIFPNSTIEATTRCEAISFVVSCRDQAEVDHYWDRLGAGADPRAQQCGWLKDRFGVSWQVVPAILPGLLGDADPDKGRRAMAAVLKMKKLDLAEIQRAAKG